MEPAMGDGEELGEGGEDDGVGAADAEAGEGAAEDEGGEGEVDAAERRAKRALTAMDAARAGRRPTRSPRTPHRMEPTSAPAKMAEVRRPLSESDRRNSAPAVGRTSATESTSTASAALASMHSAVSRFWKGPTPTRSRARSGESDSRRFDATRRATTSSSSSSSTSSTSRSIAASRARPGAARGRVTRRFRARRGAESQCTRGLRESPRGKSPQNPAAGTTVERATPWRRRCVRTNSPTRTSDGCARRSSRLRGR